MTINIEPQGTSEAMQSPLDDSTTTFHTANKHELGSQQNPIDIDQLVARQVTPHPAIGVLQRVQSNPINDRTTTGIHPTNQSESSLPLSICRICGLHGHLPDGCIQMGPFVCRYCREVGHGIQNCVERQRDEQRYNPDLQFCLFCSQPGHTFNRCAILQTQ